MSYDRQNLVDPSMSEKKYIISSPTPVNSSSAFHTSPTCTGRLSRYGRHRSTYFLFHLRHDPQLRIGPSMPIILQMCAPKHATFV